MLIRGSSFEIRPVVENELASVLEVYRQCEDFLALGPEPQASMKMVLRDIEISKEGGGIFCGIYDFEGEMIGVIDFVPSGFEGNPHHAFISLLMIALPFRTMGLGAEVVRLVEDEIVKSAQVKSILLAVQVNNQAAIKFWQRNGYKIVGGPELQPDRTTVFHLRKEVIR